MNSNLEQEIKKFESDSYFHDDSDNSSVDSDDSALDDDDDDEDEDEEDNADQEDSILSESTQGPERNERPQGAEERPGQR